MAQFYTVSNSMRAKDRDGNPKVWESQYGTFEVWNVYFENDDVKYQVNKKPGFSGYTKGQQVYGTATEGQYGGQFKQEQAPEGEAPQQHSAPSQAATGGDLEAKVDYLISLVENFLNRVEGQASTPSSEDDDKPVDFSGLGY